MIYLKREIGMESRRFSTPKQTNMQQQFSAKGSLCLVEKKDFQREELQENRENFLPKRKNATGLEENLFYGLISLGVFD